MTRTSAIGERGVSLRSVRGGQKLTCGFTLTELLVAFAIAALLLATMPFALNRVVPGYRFRVAADQLMADLRSARNRAISQGQVVTLLCEESGYAVESGERIVKAASLSTRIAVACSGLATHGKVDRIVLYPDGSTMGALLSITDGTRTALVELSSLTGRARLIR